MKYGYVELTGHDGNPCFFQVDQIQAVHPKVRSAGKSGFASELWLSGNRTAIVLDEPEVVTEKIGKALQAAETGDRDKIDLALLKAQSWYTRRFSEELDKFVQSVVCNWVDSSDTEDVMRVANGFRKTMMDVFKP